MKYSVGQLKEAAYVAGFRGPALVLAVAISLAENGSLDSTTTHPNSNGSFDYGAWQINSVHLKEGGLLAGTQPAALFDLQTNANAAYKIYHNAGNTFKPWTTYKTGAYKSNLEKARKAKRALTSSEIAGAGQALDEPNLLDDVKTSTGNVFNAATAIPTLIGHLLDGSLWKRIGIGALAVLLLIIGVIFMIMSNKNLPKVVPV